MRNLIFLLLATILFVSCSDYKPKQSESDSGVKKASVKVQTDANGNTVEQKNYEKRVTRDNELGAIKHLYIISSYTGDVLEYSTVKGKVTSGGKRLSPSTVSAGYNNGYYGMSVILGGEEYKTAEVQDEYGTYGSSSPYFYWFDAQDNYHQYYPSGGTFVHISDRPLRIKRANFSVEMIDTKK